MAKYKITHDGEIHYPPHRVAKPGDVVDDLPPGSVRWLRAEGLIEEVPDAARPVTPPATVVDAHPTQILPTLPDDPQEAAA